MYFNSLIAPSVALSAFVASSASAAVIIRGFEEFSNGTPWSQQYSEFNITTDTPNALLQVAEVGPYASDGTKALLASVPQQGAVGNAIFAANGSNRFLGFSVNGMENAGESVADVFLYNSSQTLIAQLAIIAPSTGTTAVAMDFTAYSDVARFEIRNVTDIAGFAIDRIVIDTVGVPAPGAIALLGLAGLAGRRRR